MKKLRFEALLALGLGLTLGACTRGTEEPTRPENRDVSEPFEAEGWFTDVGESLGVEFRHQDGRSGRRHYPETVASGGGWLDYDRDGDLDLYLVNGARTPGSQLEESPRNALFEQRDGLFVAVTESAGVGDDGYGMGLCVGDVDGDGHLDFYVTNYGPNRLYRNRGNSTFEEISERAGVSGDSWSTNCAFADLDGDHDLDLYVSNYVDVDLERAPQCRDPASQLVSYCQPLAFDGQPDDLYWNRGDGSFEQAGTESGIHQGSRDRGFGVVVTDLSGDGRPDILVANDGSSNRFYQNLGDSRFEDRALIAGLGLNRDGRREAGMGLDVADLNADGLLDVSVTNYSFESNTFYLQQPGLLFEDRTVGLGLEADSYLAVSWGVGFFDADNDGDLDLAIANGHILDNIDQIEEGIGYAQANQFWLNRGDGSFAEISSKVGAAFQTARVSRGLATGDFDNDGRVDLLITNTNDQPNVLKNTVANDNHWLGLALVGPPANALAIGARVFLWRDGRQLGVREVRSGGSLLSQHDLRVHFGLGTTKEPVEVRVEWPDGTHQVETFRELDRYQTLHYSEEPQRHPQ